MKNFDEIDDNINELLLHKKFIELNDEEKQKALAYASSEKEYNLLRNTLLAITGSFGDEEPEISDLDGKDALMKKFEQKFGASGKNPKIIPFYRKPYFQLAVAASIGLLIMFALPVFKNEDTEMKLAKNEVKNDIPGYESKTDKSIENVTALDSSPSVIADETKGESEVLSNEKTIVGEKNEQEEFKNLPPVLSNDVITKTESLNERKDNTLSKDLNRNEKAEEALSDDNLAANEKIIDKENQKNKLLESKKKESDAKSRSKKSANDLDEYAAGAVNSAPNAAIQIQNNTNTVNAYLEKNKNEIVDLLFTNF